MASRNRKNKGQPQDKIANSLDEVLQASRKERGASLAQEMLGTNPQKLAQEMLGKRPKTNPPTRPAGPSPMQGSLASRVGITKRSNSLPRTNSTGAPRNPRQPSHLGRSAIPNNSRPQNSRAESHVIDISSDSSAPAKSNGYSQRNAIDNGGNGLSIRGAAGGPYIVRAQNFAPGTSAADIESVMLNVGGQMNYCKLVSVATAAMVIAEMSFVDRSGADEVIKTFNNKKADGRMLYVYMQSEIGESAHADVNDKIQEAAIDEPLSAFVDTTGDTAMEVDEHADARAAEDRQREERRREPRPPPSGPSQRPADDYPRRAEPAYQDGRYGYDGRDRGYRGGSGGRGGGYRDEGRLYSDRMRRGDGQGYRR
ncbi:hypothetical protein LTR86_009325 [Recurvomyces mirabilis]|nr:hypothetical protein LTR86_009325 [Recurvomyces mirabilis]